MSTFEARRRARAGWPIRRSTIGDEPLTDELLTESIDARIAMVSALTRSQWAMAGKELQRCARAEMPGQVLRPRR